MKYLFGFLLFFSTTFVASAQFVDDDCGGELLNYENGWSIGCSLADDIGDWQLNNLVANTFRKYKSICPEYAAAVLEGFQACSGGLEPVGGLSGSPTNTTNDPDCIWNGSKWVCP